MRCCVNPEHLEAVTSKENTQRGYRATKMYCVNGHPLFGENLGIVESTGFRFCRECQRAAIRKNYRKTGGAAQKKYAENNREKRMLDMRERRANSTDEQKQARKEYERAYDAANREKRRLAARAYRAAKKAGG